MSYLSKACKYLEIKESQVLTHALYDSTIAVVYDMGIAGGKKATIPLSTLDAEPEPSTEGVLSTFTMSTLRGLATNKGIDYRGMKKRELIAAIEATD